MTKRSVFFALLFSVYCSSLSVAQLYTDEVQVISGLGGNVGIGLNNPSYKLHVKGQFLVEGDGAGNYSDINLKNGSQRWHISGPRYGDGNRLGIFWHDGTSYHDYVTIGTNGRVGIGTSSPDYLLHVSGETEILSTGSGAGFKFRDRLALAENDWVWYAAADKARLWHSGASDLLTILTSGSLGIGTSSPSQKLSVNGNASKATAGDWLANSDARLKTNISPLHSQETLQKLLRLQGITYEWSDDKTGLDRPAGIQYGFTAQNIQEVFPSLVVEDEKGYLQSSYSTYDAMLVESIRALNEEIEELKRENGELRTEVLSLRSADNELKASIEAILGLLGENNRTSTIKSEKE